MQDLAFDLEENDIIFDVDIRRTDFCSGVNVSLLLLKSVASIEKPYFGVGFQSRAVNSSQYQANKMRVEAESQAVEDGAARAEISVAEGREPGEFNYSIFAKYIGE